MLRYKLADKEDAQRLALYIRPEDAEEIRAGVGKSPLVSLFDSLRTGGKTWACYDKRDRIVAMFGSGDEDGDVGSLWMLGSIFLKANRKAVLRDSRRAALAVSLGYRLMTNLVDTRNTEHIRWLKWLGCTFSDETVPGLDPSVQFKQFFWEPTQCVTPPPLAYSWRRPQRL